MNKHTWNKKLVRIDSRGFTLVEVLVVIFIMGLLIVALTPRLSQTNINSKIDNVEADLRIFLLDINNYVLDYGGVYIDGCADTSNETNLEEESKSLIESLNAYLGFELNTEPVEVKSGVNTEGKKYCRVVVDTKLKTDPWGYKYRVMIDPRDNNIIVASPGPNSKFETERYSEGEFDDDIIVIIKGK